MPIGSYALTAPIAEHLCSRRPRRVLDLGIGFGFYGGVVRQWLDYGVKPYRTELIGVEAWADYRSPMWDLYDVVFIETIEQFVRRPLAQFDCILLTDVIEHFPKPQGAALIEALQSRVSPQGSLVIGTPESFFPQEAVHGNEWERHRSAWTVSDFSEPGFDVQVFGKKESFCGETILARWQRS